MIPKDLQQYFLGRAEAMSERGWGIALGIEREFLPPRAYIHFAQMYAVRALMITDKEKS